MSIASRYSKVYLIISGFALSLQALDSTCNAGYYLKYGKVCVPCSPGYYCEGGTLSYMKKCSPGSYTNFKAAVCTKCPQGFACADPSKPPIACKIREYSIEGGAVCSPCPIGSVCSLGKVVYTCKPGERCASTDMNINTPCPAGYRCPTPSDVPELCPTGSYSAENSALCTLCPIGSYCPSPSIPPVACPLGQYNDKLGQISCLQCPQGYFCDTNRTFKVLCDLGQFSAPSSNVCIDCPAGYMCPDQTITIPQLCVKGTYSTGKSSYCIPCPEGFSCLDRKTLTKCTSGFYSLNGMEGCLQCPPGHECSSWATPMPCAPGQYSDAGSIACNYCPAGSYCPSPLTQPLPCPIGTYQDDIGQPGCKPCPDGFKCPILDVAKAPVACASGEFTDQFHQQCYKCPAGYDCSTKRYQDMKQCTRGFYSLEGEGYCKKCPAGYQCPRVDQDKAECPIGTYSYEGATSCTMCPMGFRCLDKKGKYIVKCSLGQYVDSVTSRCTWCPAGFACPNPEAGFDNKIECQPGTYAAAGQAQCTVCPPGKYCQYTNKAVVLDCPVGKVSFGGAIACQDCPKNHECGNSTMAPCPIYHYSLQGKGICEPCPDGKQCNDLKQLAPIYCPLGYYISTLDWKCQPCPHGYFCPEGSADPQKCARHTYQNYMAQTYCWICPDGYYSDFAAEYCMPIPPGFQRSAGGLLEKCGEGYYSGYGFKECIVCEDGYLCPSGGEFGVHYGCPKGSYCIAGIQFKCSGGMFGIIERAKSKDEGCAICPAGYYCLAGTEDYKLNPCPRGYFCPVYTEIPQECPRGTYNDELFGRAIADCKLCPMGRECDVATKDQGKTCAKGYFCPLGSYPRQWPCPAGTFSGYRSGLKDQSECIVCPAGNYCPEASVDPRPVLPGYYQPHQGIGELEGQVICPPGYHCPNSAMTTYKGYHCTPGYFCPAGSTTPTQQPCPQGTFSDSSEIFDAAQCLICPGGYKCGLATTSTTVIQDCPRNEYCPPGTKVSRTNKCPAGRYAPYLNAKSIDDCIPCPHGFYCLSGQDPVTCPRGFYCPKSTEYGSQYPCPGGFFINVEGAKVLGECKSCGLGNYCFEGATEPLKCPPRYYNAYNNSADQCLECPAGRYCPKLGTREPPKCPPGKYSEKKSSKCTYCPVGTYCPNEATSDVEIQFQKCPAGVYCMRQLTGVSDVDPSDDSVTIVTGRFGLDVYPNLRDHYCTEGYYCMYGAIEMSPCPKGTYNPVRGRKVELECKRVESGYYVSTTGAAQPSGICDPGYYCPEGSVSSKQVPCPAGTFRKIPQGGKPDDCTLCTSGGYCPQSGLVEPLPCPAGFYCPLGTKQPEPCPEGTYSSNLSLTDSQSCAPCNAGKFCAKKNLTAPQDDCDDGYLCIKGSKRPEPNDKVTGMICPKGGYCTKGTTEVQWCVDGQFNVFTGGQSVVDCELCWPGYFCKGQQILVPCEAGFYCEAGSSSYTGIAQEGNYAPLGSDRQYKCPRGTYNLDPQKPSCLSCEAGRYCGGAGIIEPIDCPAGYYCPSYDSQRSQGLYYDKIKCPAGTYNPITGRKSVADCLSCTTGSYCALPGLIAPTGTCTAGYYCNSKAIEPSPQVEDANKNFGPCPAGYYCEGGDKKVACEAGTFSNVINAASSTVCKPCTEGFYCPIPGMTQPINKCDVGYYCPEGSITSKGRTKNDVEDRKCPSRTYCPLGTANPIVCPTGYYQDSDGSVTLNTKCKQCPKGSYCVFGNMYTCPKGYVCV